ncbi:hypothetical protein HPP92_028738 [Vanilla planifolia]|uniref:Uncharacterized protein n=1 Tax=Vanilla planifolia TaxID=51239 RepID=A0A835U241_VANPL|nr:hypothetical protein HPP92_028738 [Vanilla planifolia]KAG0446685.1 hypothetical protein HPP92_028727 [Vanilla planifolia]
MAGAISGVPSDGDLLTSLYRFQLVSPLPTHDFYGSKEYRNDKTISSIVHKNSTTRPYVLSFLYNCSPYGNNEFELAKTMNKRRPITNDKEELAFGKFEEPIKTKKTKTE